MHLYLYMSLAEYRDSTNMVKSNSQGGGGGGGVTEVGKPVRKTVTAAQDCVSLFVCDKSLDTLDERPQCFSIHEHDCSLFGFLPVKRQFFFLATVAKCLLMGEMLGLCK